MLDTYIHHESVKKLIADLEPKFSDLPKLPQGLIDFLVKIIPYFAVIGAVLTILATPLTFLINLVTLFVNPIAGVLMAISAVVAVVQAIIMFKAFEPLKNKEYLGWHLMFFSSLLSVAVSAVGILVSAVSGNMGDATGSAIGLVIGTLISLYFQFQIKKEYTAAAK